MLLKLKQRLYIVQNNKGMSLLELLVSIFILSIIAAPFLSLYIHATKTNLDTRQMVDATYIAQGCMEEIYHLSTLPTLSSFDDTRDELVMNYGYSETITGSEYIYIKTINSLYIKSRIDTSTYVSDLANTYKVIVEVYYDTAHNELAAKLENVVTWD